MNIAKYFGIALILTVSAAAAKIFGQSLRSECRETEIIINLIRTIKNKIEFFNSPIDSILDEAVMSNSAAGKIARIGWDGFLNEIKYVLPDEIYSTLTIFSENLGKTSREEQLELCGYTLICLDEIKIKLTENLSKRIKISETLCFVFGIFICIILI